MPESDGQGPLTLEICVDSPAGLGAAIAGGADRIELCSALSLGGLTPSPGLVALAARAPVPVYAMIRPRDGDFVFDDAEAEAMCADIAAMRAAGLAGVVLGASLPDRTLDASLLDALAREARGLGTTLHRAFDLTPDADDALEAAVALGFERILTSGGATNAAAGQNALASLVTRAAGRIAIMPGGGIRPDNIRAIAARTGARQFHASARRRVPVAPDLVAFGFASATRMETDAATVARLSAAAGRNYDGLRASR